jgi:hypothetical protein
MCRVCYAPVADRAILPHGRADAGPRHCHRCKAAGCRRSRARRGEGRHRTLERAAAACRDMLWSPMIRAALIAGTPWLDVFCPGCGTSRAIDLRKADRHPLASVATLVLGLRCSWCPECERRMAVNFTRPAGAVRNCFGSPHSTPQFGSDSDSMVAHGWTRQSKIGGRRP